MTIAWHGKDVGLGSGMAALFTAIIDPLPNTYVVAQGLRTIAEQNRLYAVGRDAAGNVINRAAILTNARGGQSAHNFGLAIDVYPVIDGAINWGPSDVARDPAVDRAWADLWGAARASGKLTLGHDFQSIVDPGHFELKNWKLYTNQPIPADATSTAGIEPYVPPDESSPFSSPDGSASGVVVVALAALGILGAIVVRRFL